MKRFLILLAVLCPTLVFGQAISYRALNLTQFYSNAFTVNIKTNAQLWGFTNTGNANILGDLVADGIYGLMGSGDVTNAAGSRVAYLSDVGGGGSVIFTNWGGGIGITNSTTETTLGSVTIPGGTLTTNGLVELFVDGAFFNQSGAGHSPYVRVYIGGTLAFGGIGPSYSSQPTRRLFSVGLKVRQQNSAAVQLLSGTYDEGASANQDVGFGSILALPSNAPKIFGGVAAIGVDTNWNFSLTVSNQTADANISSYSLGVSAKIYPNGFYP